MLIQAWFLDQGGEIARTFKYEEFEAVRRSLFDSGGATYKVKKPWDDRFVNGLTLCKNHHWAFDHDWFGLGGQLLIFDSLE